MKNKNIDRFKKLSEDYSHLFIEVFKEEGLDYNNLQKSVFDTILKYKPNIKEISILDIGIGDGETSKLFIEKGCKNLIGLDLNKNMLESSRKRFGNKIKLKYGDAINMNYFKPNQFNAIITGMSIHNIKTKDRNKFWKEILRLNPELFVSAEKIADPDLKKHKQYYNNEIKAIKKVYGERHGLKEIAEEWIKHYEFDEQEKLTIDEIKENIGHKYNIKVILEMGMCKLILAKRKN